MESVKVSCSDLQCEMDVHLMNQKLFDTHISLQIITIVWNCNIHIGKKQW